MQREIQRANIDGVGAQTLLLCEHEPVITLGRSTKSGNVLASREFLSSRGVEVLEIERGGDVTYHGPGQLVGYPLLDLSPLKRDVGWYMRSLEEVILRTLQDFSIPAVRVPERTGVWTEHTENDSFFPYRKVSSIGVRISRWCTLHGFSLNVRNCSSGFSLINPCGFTDVRVTSLEEEMLARSLVPPADLMEQTTDRIEAHFCTVFGFRGKT